MVDTQRHLTTINKGFQDINNAVVNLRTEANDEQIDALDVFQAGLNAIQTTEAHSITMAFS